MGEGHRGPQARSTPADRRQSSDNILQQFATPPILGKMISRCEQQLHTAPSLFFTAIDFKPVAIFVTKLFIINLSITF